MQKAHEPLGENLPIEEVPVGQVEALDPPAEWEPGPVTGDPLMPPVLIEEDGRFSLLVHHDSFWRARAAGLFTVRVLVVRSAVQIPPAHSTVRNALEEALLFDGLLRTGIVPNRSRLADMLGYSRARITQVLNILKLPLDIRRRLILEDGVSEFQLRPLVKIDDEKKQAAVFSRLLSDGLTGRQMALFALSGAQGSAQQEQVDLESIMASEPAAPSKEPGQAPEPAPAERRPRPIPAVQEPVVPDAPPSEKTQHQRARGLLEMLGTLREEGWEDSALRLGATREDMVFLEGVSLMRRGLYVRAAEVLVGAAHLSQKNPMVFFFLGRCHNLLDNLQLAEEHLRTACELVTDDPDILSELAIVLEKQKRYPEAGSFYRRAAQLRNPVAPRSRKP